MGRKGEPGHENLLNVATAVLLVVAGAFLVRNHLLPAWRAQQVVEVGERVPGELRLVSLVARDTLRLGQVGPALLLYYQSTCPTCARNLPAWRRLLDERPDGLGAVAVGLEAPTTALGYAREELPGAVAVRPADRARTTRLMGVEVVPTTQLVDGGGRLRWSRSGVLSAADVERILDRARGTTPAGPAPAGWFPHRSSSGRSP